MRRFLIYAIAAVCSIAAGAAGAQGVIHDNGDPRIKIPMPNCGRSPFYVDDSTQQLYIAMSGSPCVWGLPTSGGSAVVYVAPSADATGVTDNAALQAVLTAGNTAQLGAGNYYLTGLSITTPANLTCAGSGLTMLNKVTATGHLFTINYGGGQLNTESNGTTIRGCGIQMKSGVTPTAGDTFNLSGADSTHYLSGVHIENNQIWGLWGGIRTGSFMIYNYFTNNIMTNMVSGGDGCLYYNTPTPGGDADVTGLQCDSHIPAAVTINQADTTHFTNLKINNATNAVLFTRGGSTARVRFINPSIENSVTCGIDFGSGSNPPTQIQIVGGGIGLGTGNALCNTGNTVGLQYFFNDYSADNSPNGPVASWPQFDIKGSILDLTSTTLGAVNVTNSDSAGTNSTNLNLTDDGVAGNVVVNGPSISYESTLRSKVVAFAGANSTGGSLANSKVASGGSDTWDIRPGGYNAASRTWIFSKDTSTTSVPIVNSTFYSAAGTALPTCNSGAKGTQAVVSDATAPTYLATYASGGAVLSPVICNGTNWVTY